MGSMQSNQKNNDDLKSNIFEINNIKTFDTIKSIKEINCDHKCLCRIAFSDMMNQFIITDCEDNTLKLIDIDGNYKRSVNPNSILKCPWAICISKSTNEIYVADGQLAKIIVFDIDFKYLRGFGDDKINLVECMTIDDNATSSEIFLYAADYRNSLVTVWNSETGKFKLQFSIQSPSDIGIAGDKIFITSENKFQFVSNTRKLDYLNGENCIYVLNKLNFDVINKIKLSNWLSPTCIYFDRQNNHLITVAFNIDDEMNVSKTRYLYIIDQDTLTCLYKVDLNIDKTSDMCIIDKKILFCRGPFSPSVYMLEF